MFTTGWVRKYNTGISRPAVGTGTATAETDGTAATSWPLDAWPLDAWLRNAGLAQAGTLAHIIERCRDFEEQANRLIDHHTERIDGHH